MNQYREDTHAQFGNVRFVKEVQSLCNQLGRERYLCEIYGAGGWDLRFEDMKRIADWLGVLGVNLFDEHLSYVTLRGARKADHPQSFSYHEPWWDSYHVMAQYITRLSAAMSLGEQRNRVLVIQPTTTAWMYQADATHAGQLGEIGKTFFDLLMGFERAQVEYDIGCEDVIARHGSGARKPGGQQIGAPFRFAVGQRAYTTVVLPPMTETLRSETMKLLEEAAAERLADPVLRPAAGAGGRPAVGPRRETGQEPRLAASRSGPRHRDARAGAGPGPLRDPPRRRTTRASSSTSAGNWPTAICCCWSTPASTPRRRALSRRRPRASRSGTCSPGRSAPIRSRWRTGRRSSTSSFRPAAACCCSSPRSPACRGSPDPAPRDRGLRSGRPAVGVGEVGDRERARGRCRSAGSGRTCSRSTMSTSPPAARPARTCTTTAPTSWRGRRTACRATRGTAPCSTRTS